MSQSLVARAVPRALDPYSTTASMPGIEPTASAAVRLRRSCVVGFIGAYPREGVRNRSAHACIAPKGVAGVRFFAKTAN